MVEGMETASGDAPGDEPGDAAGAAPPRSLAVATASVVAGPPAPPVGRRPGGRRRPTRPPGTRPALVVVPRPGSAFHAGILSVHSHGVAFDPVAYPALSEPGVVWVTPPSAAACFSASTVSGLVSIFFCHAPEKLVATAVGDWVFSVPVASPDIAQAIVSGGLPAGASVKLLLHASRTDAMLAVSAFTVPTHPPTAGRGVTVGVTARSLSARRRRPPPRSLLPPLLPIPTSPRVVPRLPKPTRCCRRREPPSVPARREGKH